MRREANVLHLDLHASSAADEVRRRRAAGRALAGGGLAAKSLTDPVALAGRAQGCWAGG